MDGEVKKNCDGCWWQEGGRCYLEPWGLQGLVPCGPVVMAVRRISSPGWMVFSMVGMSSRCSKKHAP